MVHVHIRFKLGMMSKVGLMLKIEVGLKIGVKLRIEIGFKVSVRLKDRGKIQGYFAYFFFVSNSA